MIFPSLSYCLFNIGKQLRFCPFCRRSLSSYNEKMLWGQGKNYSKYSVCNIYSMKSPAESNSLLLKLFCYFTTWSDERWNWGLTNEVYLSNSFVSSKQWHGDLKTIYCVLIFISKQEIMDISLAWCDDCLYCLIPKIMWAFVNIDLTSNDIVY